MIANFFNQTRPINFLVLSVLVLIIFVVALININSDSLSLYFFVKNGAFLSVAILIIFVFNFIIRKNSLSDDNSYAILFYILLCSFFPQTFSNGGIFVANFILFFAFRKIYSLRTSSKTKEKIFDAAFWIGIASLFYIWSLIFMILLYAAILIFRKADWRNVLIPFLGLLTPIFLSYTYLLFFNDLERFQKIWVFENDLDFSIYNSVKYLIPLISIGLLVVISIFPTTNKSLTAKIDVKSTWFVLIAHFFVSLLVVLLSPDKNGSELIFLFFPVSVLFANYLQLMKKYWIKESILYLFFLIFLIVSI